MEDPLSEMKKYNKYVNRLFGITEPYDNYEPKLTNDMPSSDPRAYRIFPNHNFVYDKLFIAQSQNMKSGDLRELHDKKVKYPIFIKPRYGHKTSSSKDCYKIKSDKELFPHMHKPEMMWSEFVDAREGMTDFILVGGHIVYQLTYQYSEKQNGFADDWKFISPETKPPEEIVSWVEKHMHGYTGPLNVQYRDTKIIEVGLRFARAGDYIESTGNHTLVHNINQMWKTKTWDHRNEDKLSFEPFYSFKCWSPIPIIHLMPHYVIHKYLNHNGAMPLHEYYFEPTGTSSLIFYQFLHKDFKKGMKIKKHLEKIFLATNLFLWIMTLIGIILLLIKPTYGYGVLTGVILIFLFGLINPPRLLYKQIRNQKQFFT